MEHFGNSSCNSVNRTVVQVIVDGVDNIFGHGNRKNDSVFRVEAVGLVGHEDISVVQKYVEFINQSSSPGFPGRDVLVILKAFFDQSNGFVQLLPFIQNFMAFQEFGQGSTVWVNITSADDSEISI